MQRQGYFKNNLVKLPNNHSIVNLDVRRLTQATSQHIFVFFG